MKTAIIYASKYGTTENVAREIGKKLQGTTDIEFFSLKSDPVPDIRDFDTIVLGTSIYAGKPLSKMTAFCDANEAILSEKRLGLFVCGMEQSPEGRKRETEAAYPEALRNKAVAVAFLGGEFLFESMGFFPRFIAQKIAKTKTSVSQIDTAGIDDFVRKLL